MKRNLTLNIAAVIAFLGATAMLITMIVSYEWKTTEADTITGKDILLFSVVTLICITVIYYVAATRFGNVYISESRKIEEENEVLRKKIEQRELLTRLRSAEVDAKVN